MFYWFLFLLMAVGFSASCAWFASRPRFQMTDWSTRIICIGGIGPVIASFFLPFPILIRFVAAAMVSVMCVATSIMITAKIDDRQRRDREMTRRLSGEESSV